MSLPHNSRTASEKFPCAVVEVKAETHDWAKCREEGSVGSGQPYMGHLTHTPPPQSSGTITEGVEDYESQRSESRTQHSGTHNSCTRSHQSTFHSRAGSIHEPPTHSWGPVGTLWLLGEEEPVSFKGTAPSKLPTLRWVSPTPLSM